MYKHAFISAAFLFSGYFCRAQTLTPTAPMDITTAGYDWKTLSYSLDMSASAGSGGWARDFRIYNAQATTNRMYFGATGGAGTASRAFWTIGDTSAEGYLFTSGLQLLSSGNVGIGTQNPTAKLYVNSGDNVISSVLATNVEGPGELRVRSYTTQPTYAQSFALVHSFYNDENNGFIKFYRGVSTGGGFITLGSGGVERVRVDSLGNVGIGTATPTQKLSVSGTILAKEVIVQTGWADYVFAKGYSLPSLSAVECSIAKDGHLPGIPSGHDVEEKGLSVGAMQAKLLEKIEELTLYIIEQEKHQKAQDEKIEEQRREIESLKTTKNS